jgi:membrane glycosyltransferase
MDERLTPAPGAEPDPAADVLVPAQSRCEMPEQVLWTKRREGSRAARRVLCSRIALVILWALGTCAFAWTLYRVLSVESPTILQLAFLVLSTVCFAWVSVGSATAIVGLASLLSARGADTLVLPAGTSLPRTRTALLFPVYREDPVAVAATIEAMCRDLVAAKANAQFAVFILSDTQDPAERTMERHVYSELRLRLEPHAQIFVRWRTPNIGKKSGNIRDWVEGFGAAYPYFIILDADSIMSAEAMLRLVAGMESHPRAGLIQTVPRLVGGESLFARLQQFAGCYYGQILAAGLAAWHGGGGNYWGHNAIIRTAAFAASAGLPKLKGAPPLGGHILSHDFVEAALLRRAGWEVHLAPSVQGSFEGCPPTLTDLIVRDRRWAQGNLQHMRLLGVSGLPFLSRVHLAMGVLSYMASPIWALTLLIGVVLAIQAKYATPSYFGTEASLFPKWPVFDAQTALVLFCATVFVVHLPKLLGAGWALRNSAQRRLNGGIARVVGGVLLESLLSTLIAPVLMLTQTSAVAAVLLGRDAGWGAQQRTGAGVTLRQLLRQHRWHVLWGAAGAAICWTISPVVFAWMSPIILGLLVAPVLALATARHPRKMLTALLATADDRERPVLLAARTVTREGWRILPGPQRSDPVGLS